MKFTYPAVLCGRLGRAKYPLWQEHIQIYLEVHLQSFGDNFDNLVLEISSTILEEMSHISVDRTPMEHDYGEFLKAVVET